MVIFEISSLKFCEKTKIPKFGPKNALVGYFCGRIWKNYFHIWNQHIGISITAKFCEETKMPKFGTKNALFGDFLPRIPHLDIFGLEFQKYYGHIWNQQTQLSLKNQKYLNLGPKMSYLGNLGAEFKKDIVIFEISTLEFA